MGYKDLGAYDVHKYAHNIPAPKEDTLPDVIGTDELSEEDGCNYLESAAKEKSEDE